VRASDSGVLAERLDGGEGSWLVNEGISNYSIKIVLGELRHVLGEGHQTAQNRKRFSPPTPTKMTKPARRIQVKNEASMLCDRGMVSRASNISM
jgi:hypothetical protein